MNALVTCNQTYCQLKTKSIISYFELGLSIFLNKKSMKTSTMNLRRFFCKVKHEFMNFVGSVLATRNSPHTHTFPIFEDIVYLSKSESLQFSHLRIVALILSSCKNEKL